MEAIEPTATSYDVPPPAPNLKFDGERAIPEHMQDTAVVRDQLENHIDRYRLAGRCMRGLRVLDAACGVGYGTALLRSYTEREVVGVDNHLGALEYARQRYAVPGVSFRQADLNTFACETGVFDAVVCFETIEHLVDPPRFVERVWNLLPPGGVFAVSTPVTPMLAEDPFHLHEWTATEFRALIAGGCFETIDELLADYSWSGPEMVRTGMRHPDTVHWRHIAKRPLRMVAKMIIGWRHWQNLTLVTRKPGVARSLPTRASELEKRLVE